MLNSWKSDAGETRSAATSETQPARSTVGAVNSIAISIDRSNKPEGNSTIDSFLTMRGDLESDADILVKGNVFGNVSCNLLIVDEGAIVKGGITANEVIIRGSVDGIIQAEKVRLERTAHVRSDIFHKTFTAEEGAQIIGALKSLKDAPKANVVTMAQKCELQTGDQSRPPPLPTKLRS